MRDNNWLEEKLEELWEDNYADVPRKNKVVIKFGKRAKRVLGSIKYSKKMKETDPEYSQHEDKKISQITITRHFMDPEIPDEVVLGTIAHEMVHYAHGFNSPLQQLYNHPHKGGIIKKEMYKRGLGKLFEVSEGWIKKNWVKYLTEKGELKNRRRPRRSVRYSRNARLLINLLNRL